MTLRMVTSHDGNSGRGVPGVLLAVSKPVCEICFGGNKNYLKSVH